MPVPFETLLPYAIMIGMFGVTGTGLAAVKTWRNEGKRPRYSLDQWDKQSKMLPCAQCTNQPEAPLGFEFSNGWKMEKRFS
ncbi:hypothetical protein VFPBJ_06874 [Purpureocillium lilacinum]|uniref:NADH dehydrogenase [ubiquinone] 1 alpha subcomplex subunit 1 n=1 Tax=Purpureocillium lilacinum TaxID=33203 RepID=A0A179GN67_PURLI|nr:hypothetical protein VFPBJ_06874 [Purpureocillium lilacinum]